MPGVTEPSEHLIERIRPYYPRFSQEEYARRYEAVRRAMNQDGLAGLIVYGSRGIGHGANLKYLTNYADYRTSYVVFPLEGSPTLFAGLPSHVFNARAISVIQDVRWSGNDAATPVVERAKELGFAGKRVGIAGAARSFQSIPREHFLAFQQGLPATEFVNATKLLEEIRTIPSEEEMERIRLGAALTDKAIEVLIERARPGISEHQLVSEVKHVIGGMEGEFHVFLLGSTPMDDPFMPYPWPFPSSRVLQKGDIILTEISVDPWGSGYPGQSIRPIALGEPTEEYWRLFSLAKEIYLGVQPLMKTGNEARTLHQVTGKIHEAGYTIQAPITHGLNQCLTPPMVGIPQIADWNSGLERRFLENERIVIEPNPCTKDLRMGIFLGDLQRVTAKGAVSFQKVPLEFVIKKV